MTSEQTPNLKLPYIIAAQAQKHVTHNEALRALDAVVQLSVLDRDLTAPPDTPANGDRYIVGPAASGDWSGRDNRIAAFQDNAWMYFAPQTGWLVWVADEAALLAWQDDSWIAAGASTDPAQMFGVNTAADAANRLAVKSDAVLFSHDDVTPGSGDVRHKLNKAAAGGTAALLFQDGWSGRAEIGLTGDDDFHFKVSPDGAAWHEAMVLDRQSGRVSFPGGGVREALQADRTYHVAPGGDDGNDGLSSQSALASIQAAVDKCYRIDSNGHAVVIQLADGLYSASNGVITLSRAILGGARLTFQGNAAQPENVVLEGSYHASRFLGGCVALVKDMQLRSSSNGSSLQAIERADVYIDNLVFPASLRKHIEAMSAAVVTIAGDYAITGGASQYHISVSSGGQLAGSNRTATLTGSPHFGTAFVGAETGGVYQVWNQSWTGAATGRRYNCSLNGVINTFGKGAGHFPGDTDGTAATGGRYN